jgi:hypothetical protein
MHWPWRRRGAPLLDFSDPGRPARLAEIRQRHSMASRLAAEMRGWRPPLHAWLDLQLARPLPLADLRPGPTAPAPERAYGTFTMPPGMLPIHLEAWYEAQQRHWGR